MRRLLLSLALLACAYPAWAQQGVTILDPSDPRESVTVITAGETLGIATVIVDGNGNPITSFGGSGGTATTDDTPFTAGVGLGTPALGFFSADTVDAGDVGVLAMDASRRLLVSIEVDNAGIGGGVQYTEPATDATATGTVTFMEAAADALVPLQGTVADGLLVNLGGNNDIVASNDGTFAVQVDGAALTALQLIDNPIATIGTTPLQRVAIFGDDDTQITSFGGGTQYTEDAAAAADPTGTAPILVRIDTPAALVSAVGDNVAQRGTDFGAGLVQVVDSSGNFVDTFGGSGGTALADDGDVTAGTTQGTPLIGFYESTPTACTDGDGCIAGIDADRNLKVNVVAGSAAGTEYAEGATDATFTGPVMMLEGAMDTAVTAKAADGGSGSSTDQTMRVISSIDDPGNVLLADIQADTSVIQSNTLATTDELVDLNANLVSSGTHDAVVPNDGIHYMLESKDFDGSALPSAVTGEGDSVRASASLNGVTYMMPVSENGADFATVYTVPAPTINCNTPLTAIYDNNLNDTTEVIAISGSTVISVCGYEIMAEGDVHVQLVSGTGVDCATPGADETPAWDLTANSGKVLPVFGSGYYFQTAAGDALCVETDAAVQVQLQVYYVQQ